MEQGIKRTQRDYSLAFKLSVVAQVEKGELTYKEAQQRYGIQGMERSNARSCVLIDTVRNKIKTIVARTSARMSARLVALCGNRTHSATAAAHALACWRLARAHPVQLPDNLRAQLGRNLHAVE